jgi:SHS2 domain-containing protein
VLAVSYRWVEHTTALEIEIEASTEEGVFVDALLALAELLGHEDKGAPVCREIAIGGRERAALLVEWLDELVFIAETEDLVPENAVRVELSGDGLAATVRCRRGSPRHLIKAATYHRLAFEPAEHGFRATVVLDV